MAVAAAKTSYLSKKSYRFLSDNNNRVNSSDSVFEFDESDLWSSKTPPQLESKKSIPTSGRSSKKLIKKVVDHGSGIARSLPVNIPDWSKMVKEENNNNSESDDEDEDGNDKVPPHEYLLTRQMRRTQIACSFSVHEGRGRTLKGRDLSRVRNAIWEKTGFED